MKEKREHGIIPQPKRRIEGEERPAYLRPSGYGVVLRVRVQPRSSRESVTAETGEFLKVRVNAPPVEGAANEACRKFLAEFFGIENRRVEILSGLKSREKCVLLRGVDEERVLTVISDSVGKLRK